MHSPYVLLCYKTCIIIFPQIFYAGDLRDAQLGAPQYATTIKQMTGNWQHAVDLLSATKRKTVWYGPPAIPSPSTPAMPSGFQSSSQIEESLSPL